MTMHAMGNAEGERPLAFHLRPATFHRQLFVLATAIVLGLAPSSLLAQASFPMLMSLDPIAVQAGGPESEHLVTARYSLYGTYSVLVNGSGVQGSPIEAASTPVVSTTAMSANDRRKAEEKTRPNANPDVPRLKIRLEAAADALPGVREFRLATPQGLSTVGQVVVVRDPVIVETKGNDTAAKATPITIPAAACGTIETPEDVDYFRFVAKAGQTLTFHVRSARCEDKIHDLQAHIDPIISLKNSAGVVLAASDNFFFADPALSYAVKADGDYYLEIRDVRYQGNAYWQYCVEISDRPLAVTALPSAVQAGKKATLELLGLAIAPGTQAEVDVPADLTPGVHWLQPRALGKNGAAATFNPVPLLVVDSPVASAAAAAKEPQDVALPTVVAGRIAQPNEAHRFVFAAKKAEAFEFEVTARRAQSMLDPVLAVYGETGKRTVEADDYTWHRLSSSDALLDKFIAPADGRYVVEIRDLHQRGGELFAYSLQLRRAAPTFALHADMDKVLLCGDTRGCVFVRAIRKHGFAGEIELDVEGLPPGVTAQCGRILADGTDGCIIFTAEKGTKPLAKEVRIVGRAAYTAADGTETKLTATAFPWQETYMPGGGRGHFPVESFFLDVCDPQDITRVVAAPTEIKLKPGASQKIEVSIERATGFEKSVTLDLTYRHLASSFGNTLPKGVTIDDKQSKLILSAKDVKGHIMLKAAADAPPVEGQLVPVMAQAAINFVMKLSYCGEPLRITVEK